MTGEGDTQARDPVDLLVERFLERRRSEPKLTAEQFAAEHPQQAAALLDLLPTILALEGHKRDRAASGSGGRRAALPKLERLGEFRIVREVGRGGMGVVFEAVQESLGRKVALKVLPQAALLAGNQLERFRREAQIAAQLHHSNIVPVFGSGESDGYHWYAMQFIEGEGLDGWREAQRAAPPQGPGAWRTRARFVARLGAQAASALHHAHGFGTLHRDIKPGNLLLQGGDHLWVTDFGLAKALEAEGLTHSGDILGTLQYMAPEQFQGRYDVRSEVYALGVTLYELLTLKPAFAGGSRSEVMERIRQHRREPLRKACPELPEDLAVVVEKACALDPQDRYADCSALARDLRAFLDDQPVAARRLSAAAQLRRWGRRNRALASLAVATSLAVVGTGVMGWVSYGVTSEALARAEVSATLAAQESRRAEQNLDVTLDAFGRVFDALVGPAPTLAVDEDEETGEATVLVRAVVDPKDLALLQEMLAFYDRFAAQNEGNAALRFETARACWRVGMIHARLGAPVNLEAAGKAYQQALDHLGAVADRDVRRERAAVLVESAQLARRRGQSDAARSALAAALALLEALSSDSSRAIRLDRAEVHYLLASDLPFGRRPPFGPGGRAERGGEGERERATALREHAAKAMALVDGVLAEDPASDDAKALKARCLLLSARSMRRQEPGRGDGDRERAQAAAIAILRDVVAREPERDDDRFELCRALLEPMRREDGPRGAREASQLDASICAEAVEHAARLVASQPSFREYQRLQAQANSALGRALLARADAPGEDAATRAARLQQAEAALRVTVRLESRLVVAGAPLDRALVLQSLQSRRALVAALEAQGKRDEAKAEVAAALDRLEQLEGDRANLPRLGELLAPRPGFADGSLRDQLRSVVERVGEPALAERLRALLARLPERGEGPPADGRRGR
jgi:hypothetical protein